MEGWGEEIKQVWRERERGEMNNSLTREMKPPQRAFGAARWEGARRCSASGSYITLIPQEDVSPAQRYAEQGESNVLRLHPAPSD